MNILSNQYIKRAAPPQNKRIIVQSYIVWLQLHKCMRNCFCKCLLADFEGSDIPEKSLFIRHRKFRSFYFASFCKNSECVSFACVSSFLFTCLPLINIFTFCISYNIQKDIFHRKKSCERKRKRLNALQHKDGSKKTFYKY